jgi:hypothetical protein
MRQRIVRTKHLPQLPPPSPWMSGFLVVRPSVWKRAFATELAEHILCAKKKRQSPCRHSPVDGGTTVTELLGRRILIVEEEFLAALMLEDFLHALGCVVVGIALQAPQASKLIESNPGAVDAAILESSRKHEASHEIAAMLDARGIPFIVSTLHRNPWNTAGFETRVTLQKPYSKNDLEQALKVLNWAKPAVLLDERPFVV